MGEIVAEKFNTTTLAACTYVCSLKSAHVRQTEPWQMTACYKSSGHLSKPGAAVGTHANSLSDNEAPHDGTAGLGDRAEGRRAAKPQWKRQ